MVMADCSAENIFGTRELFAFAEAECSSVTTCVGILDEGCNNAGPYGLCKKGFIGSIRSCMYQKKEYTGRFSYL